MGLWGDLITRLLRKLLSRAPLGSYEMGLSSPKDSATLRPV